MQQIALCLGTLVAPIVLLALAATDVAPIAFAVPLAIASACAGAIVSTLCGHGPTDARERAYVDVGLFR